MKFMQLRAVALAAMVLVAPSAHAASFVGVLDGALVYDPSGTTIANPFSGPAGAFALEGLFDGVATTTTDFTDAALPLTYVATLDLLIENVAFAGWPIVLGPFDIQVSRQVFAGPFGAALAGAAAPVIAAVSTLFPGAPGATNVLANLFGAGVDAATLYENTSGSPMNGVADVLIGVNDDAGVLASLVGLGPLPPALGGLLGAGFVADVTATLEVRPVPLPAALPMLAAAVAGIGWAARRRG